jgi:hypothetical protein
MAVRRREYAENGTYKVNRYLEYLSEQSLILNPAEYYAGNKEYDDKEYDYYNYQAQLNNNYADCSSVYNGLQNKTLVLSQTETGEATAYCPDGTFSSADENKRIYEYFGYDLEDGEALILEVIDAQNLRINIKKPFAKTQLGNFVLAVNKITLPAIYRNKIVVTMADGGKGQEYEIGSDCVLNLQYAVKFLIVGFKYTGLFKSVNLNILAEDGNTASSKKSARSAEVYFYNSVSCKAGTNPYDLSEVITGPSQERGKPPKAFTGMKTIIFRDSPNEEKELYFYKDDYCACNIQLANIEVEN